MAAIASMAPATAQGHVNAPFGKDYNTAYQSISTPTSPKAQSMQQHHEQQQQQPSLRLSPPRSNVYRHPHHAQIRPLKSPLYVPAVLRPTEKPNRHSPPKHNEENTRPGDDSWGAIVGSEDMMAGPASAGVSGTTSPLGLRNGVAAVTMDELLDIKGPVTGLPSTNHWKPDSAAPICNSRLCTSRFSFLIRRHHCRRCGNIFCWEHSARRAPLDQHALFHPAGTPSRVCDRCYGCYSDWEVRRSSRSGSESSCSTASGSADSSRSPMLIRANSVSSAPLEDVAEQDQEEQQAQGEFRPKSFVASIPNHWNWSTF